MFVGGLEGVEQLNSSREWAKWASEMHSCQAPAGKYK